MLPGWVGALNCQVLAAYRTRLCGGYDEPFYCSRSSDDWAEIRFTLDFERSALHELAHWCVAGSARRRMDDYGYWYAPDGRCNRQQQLFFRVEARPQAIERYFCSALDIPFEVSIDNLGNSALDGVNEFRQAVDRQYAVLLGQDMPERTRSVHDCLRAWHHGGCD